MNVLVALTLPSLAVASNIFAHDEIQPRVVGGFPGGIGAYPYFCHAITNTSVCGGTLIAADVVLTVKSCKNVFQGNEVFIGSNDRLGRDFAQRIRVSSLQIHPTEDLMLVLLNETSNNTLVSLNLDETLAADRPLFTIGFGKSTEEESAYSDSLMEVDMFLLENGICKLQVGDLFNETTQYCASFPFGGPCDGDEGGPLLDQITQEQSGVYSYNVGCTNQPSVYIRLSTYADWITNFVCSNATLAPEELCGVTGGNKGKKSNNGKKSKSSSRSKKSATGKSSKKGKGSKGKGSKDSVDAEMEDYFYLNSTHHFLNETHFHNATAHGRASSSKKLFKKENNTALYTLRPRELLINNEHVAKDDKFSIHV